jgi:hypothetical protein
MKVAQFFERLAGSLAIVACGLVVSANEGCLQKDVDFAPSANLQATGTATPTDDDDLTTPTPGSGTQTPVSTARATAVPTENGEYNVAAAMSDGAGTETDASGDGDGLLLELSKLSNGGTASQRSGAGSNWLGEAFGGGDGDSADKVGVCTDSDGDGFLDNHETSVGSDPESSGSTPPQPTTRISDRLRGVDTDMDGLGDSEDPDPGSPDSDRDGRLDGAEMLSGGNVQDPNDTYADDDGDGLSNEFEDRRGTSPTLKDSDGDGLSDALEFAIGSNPHVCDTDGDGVTDGAEVNIFRSDPTRGESAGRK